MTIIRKITIEIFDIYKGLKHLKYAKKAYESQEWQKSLFHYTKALKYGTTLTKEHAQIFNDAKAKFRHNRLGAQKRVAVCGWDLSHNAAGRVLTLADIYQFLQLDTTIIGCIVSENPEKTKHLWEPMLLDDRPCEYFVATDIDSLVAKAFDFVSLYPFDVVHLSKPRLPNIVIGRLYELIWGSLVIMDVDDEELAFSRLDGNLTPAKHPTKTDLKTIRNEYWLNKSVKLANTFDALTVSNIALQQRYGGLKIAHSRNADKFKPSAALKSSMRKQFSIPLHFKVILFLGTPKPHKGLLETAKALQKINQDEVLYLIMGDFIDKDFEQELKSISGVNFRFMPNQPYSRIHELVAVGDICVILQDKSSVISQFQLPAKLVDALAMGLTVLGTQTPSLQPLIDAGVVIATDKQHLAEDLATLLNTINSPLNYKNISYFKENLSTQFVASKIANLLNQLTYTPKLVRPEVKYTISTLTQPNLP